MKLFLPICVDWTEKLNYAMPLLLSAQYLCMHVNFKFNYVNFWI